MTIDKHLQNIRLFLFLTMHTPDPLEELFGVQEASRHALAWDVLYGHSMHYVCTSIFSKATHRTNSGQENPKIRRLEMKK